MCPDQPERDASRVTVALFRHAFRTAARIDSPSGSSASLRPWDLVGRTALAKLARPDAPADAPDLGSG